MEYSQNITVRPRAKILAVIIAGLFCISASSLCADTYRWKDKDGNTHYGAAVPAEYADQPYDIINNAGVVIEHVEDTSVPMEVRAEEKIKKKREPLISEKTRQQQSDKLLVIRYSSEAEILKAQELELAQLGYDKKVINQSYKSTNIAIRTQIAEAANQQRAGQAITPEKQKEIDQLYLRQIKDDKKRTAMSNRESRIRERYQAEIERYRYLTGEPEETDQAPGDQG